jgi:hypothetical protein
MQLAETNVVESMADETQLNEGNESTAIKLLLEKEKSFIASLLEATDNGFFVLDNNLKLQDRFSPVLTGIFGHSEIKGNEFIEVIKNRVPGNIITETEEYLKLMFREDLDEETISELNPLSSIEFHYEDPTGLWHSTRHLSFTFHRHFSDNKISALIGVVDEVTETIDLKKELESIKKNTKIHIEWLVNILHVEPPLMNEFISIIDNELDHLDDMLKNSMGNGGYRPIVVRLTRSVNHIRSSSSLLELKFFNNNIIQLEQIIKNLKDKSEIEGTDFVPIVMQLSEIRSINKEIKKLIGELKLYKNTIRTTRRFESGFLIKALLKMVDQACRDFQKDVNFVYDDFDSLSIPYTYQQFVRDYLLILLQFTILHSIEKPQERKSLNKNPVAKIKIETFITPGEFGFKIKHDGRLEQIERLIEQTAGKNIPKEDKIKNKGNPEMLSDVMRYLFTPDTHPKSLDEAEISKKIYIDMELAKKKLKMRGGKIRITFSAENFCEYAVTLPKTK